MFDKICRCHQNAGNVAAGAIGQGFNGGVIEGKEGIIAAYLQLVSRFLSSNFRIQLAEHNFGYLSKMRELSDVQNIAF